MPSQPTPVFILGSGRSGTTITSALLNQMAGIQIAKETGFLGQYLPRLKTLSEADNPAPLIDELSSWIQANRFENRASVEGFQAFCRQFGIHGGVALIHYVWQLDSTTPWDQLSYIGDNTPLYVLAIPGILELFPDARFIHIVRDPRDVVCSIRKMRFGANHVAVAAMEWHTYLGSWLMAERFIPAAQRIEFRYEDLCTNPLDTLTRLAQFLGRSRDDANVALHAHAAGTSRRRSGFEAVAAASHHTRLTEPISPSRVGRFRSELSDAEIRSIEEIAQYGMLAYGYEVSSELQHPLLTENRTGLLRAMISDVASRALRRLRGQ
jgi:hypothetical protein